MKNIKVLGKTYQYEVIYDFSEYGSSVETKFYDGVEIVRYRQFLLFGRILKKAKPKFFFKVDYNIESKDYTKTELKKILIKDFTHHIGLLNREAEIARGELI